MAKIFLIIAMLCLTSELSTVEKESAIKKEEKNPNASSHSDKDTKEDTSQRSDGILNNIKEKRGDIRKYLKEREWYKQREGIDEQEQDVITTQDEADLSSIKKGAVEDLKTIVVLLGELAIDDDQSLFAPVFLTEKKNIFGSKTHFNLKWVGYKATIRFKQEGFPWSRTTLTETLIGSFLHASGTNIGFSGGALREEKRFYTNYVSQGISLKRDLPRHTSIAFTVDSRQYFFIERGAPYNFKMPMNHINVFPRIDFIIDYISESGIDQLTNGIKLVSWAGYGVRNRWEKWGEYPDYEMGKEARTFAIYSLTLISGLLFNNNHNFIIRARYKGGVDNDFLNRPRFGGTVDNAKLDVVHGFTIEKFRVKRFGLVNLRYAFNICKLVRMSLFIDYAHIFSPSCEDVFGSGYGFRIITFGGLPLWLTHGIGKRYYPEKEPIEQVFMVMAAAGW